MHFQAAFVLAIASAVLAQESDINLDDIPVRISLSIYDRHADTFSAALQEKP